MSETTFIYALKEPDTGEIRYIGKADSPSNRFRCHISETKSEKERSHRNNWIKSLLSRGTKPILEIIDEVLSEHWQQLEIAYIEFFREQGCKLVNGTIGGDGVGSGENSPCFGKKLSLEHRQKIALSGMGRKKSPEDIEKWRQAVLGRKCSLDSRKRMSEAALGRRASLETRKKMSDAQSGEKNGFFGKTHSTETKEKLSTANMGKRCREDHPLFGKKHSLETRAKMSASAKLRCEREKGKLWLG